MDETGKKEEAGRQEALAFARRTAEKFGYVLNPDAVHLARLAGHLARNKAEHGRYYCPCKQHYPVRPESDPVCPCAEFRDEIARRGHCECHLFYDPEAARRRKERPGLLATVTCPG